MLVGGNELQVGGPPRTDSAAKVCGRSEVGRGRSATRPQRRPIGDSETARIAYILIWGLGAG